MQVIKTAKTLARLLGVSQSTAARIRDQYGFVFPVRFEAMIDYANEHPLSEIRLLLDGDWVGSAEAIRIVEQSGMKGRLFDSNPYANISNWCKAGSFPTVQHKGWWIYKPYFEQVVQLAALNDVPIFLAGRAVHARVLKDWDWATIEMAILGRLDFKQAVPKVDLPEERVRELGEML